MPQQYVSPSQFAEIISVHRKTVHKLISTGVIPSMKVGRSRRIPVDSAIEHLQAREKPRRSKRTSRTSG